MLQLGQRVEDLLCTGAEQLVGREPAGAYAQRDDPEPARGLAVPGRVADGDRVTATDSVAGDAEQVRLGLGGVDVVGRGPRVDGVPHVEQVDVVLDVLGRSRAG